MLLFDESDLVRNGIMAYHRKRDESRRSSKPSDCSLEVSESCFTLRYSKNPMDLLAVAGGTCPRAIDYLV